MTLGKLIAQKREELNIRKLQLAKMLNVGDDTLRKWEIDKYIPGGVNMINLIKILKISKQELKDCNYKGFLVDSWFD